MRWHHRANSREAPHTQAHLRRRQKLPSWVILTSNTASRTISTLIIAFPPPLDFSGIAAGLAITAKAGGLDLAADDQRHPEPDIPEPDQAAPVDLSGITAAFAMIAKAYSPPAEGNEPFHPGTATGQAAPVPRLDQLPAAARGGFPPNRLIVPPRTVAPGSRPGQALAGVPGERKRCAAILRWGMPCDTPRAPGLSMCAAHYAAASLHPVMPAGQEVVIPKRRVWPR